MSEQHRRGHQSVACPERKQSTRRGSCKNVAKGVGACKDVILLQDQIPAPAHAQGGTLAVPKKFIGPDFLPGVGRFISLVDNFAGIVPTVYRGPYEFAVPGAPKDFMMQTEPMTADEPALASRLGDTSGNGHDGHKR